MSPCPNLFDLIYQHAASPFTRELTAATAVVLGSAYTLLLMLMLPEVWQGVSTCYISALITEQTAALSTDFRKAGLRRADKAAIKQGEWQESGGQPQSVSCSHFTPLIPSISFSLFLHDSPLISSRPPISEAARADDISLDGEL